jgi:hypothetical protein
MLWWYRNPDSYHVTPSHSTLIAPFKKLCIVVLMFFNKQWSGIHRWEYPHYVHIVHSTLITFSTKITLQSRYDQGAFSSQYLSRNSVVCRCEFPYPHCATMSHSTLITLFMKIMHLSKFYRGALQLSVQGVMWWSLQMLTATTTLPHSILLPQSNAKIIL